MHCDSVIYSFKPIYLFIYLFIYCFFIYFIRFLVYNQKQFNNLYSEARLQKAKVPSRNTV